VHDCGKTNKQTNLDVTHLQFSVKLSFTNKDNLGCKMEFWMSETILNKKPEQSDTGTLE
jgi:hypothetical protein